MMNLKKYFKEEVQLGEKPLKDEQQSLSVCQKKMDLFQRRPPHTAVFICCC